MKKQKVHFSVSYSFGNYTACGADIQSHFSEELKITDNRKRVTCKNCKATKRFRRVK